ncbi:MAG: hypothetical protein M3Q65_08765 [Chloroflexota bacterium]|nr:hypothetical protein [Chloroflexota bacterium]
MDRLDIRDGLRDEERRRRDEARLNALEEQIEALRVGLRESGGRQARAEEAHGALEAALERLEGRLDGARIEIEGLNHAREVDTTRLRQAIDGLDARLATLTRPIPDLQAQVAEAANQARAKFEELTQDQGRFDQLQVQIDRLPPQIDRATEIARGVRDQQDAVREMIEVVRGDMQRINDSVGIVEQDVRRRVRDALAKLEETDARIDALREELPPLNVQIDRVRHELHQTLPRFDVLEAADAALREEVERDAALDFDRHVQALARLDETREALEERVRLVERLGDTRFGATMARFTELEDADRALGHRITLLALRLDELRDQDAAIRAEMRQLEALRVRVRLEQAQQEAASFSQRLAELQASLEVGADGDEEA